jgi:hypothetical protein
MRKNSLGVKKRVINAIIGAIAAGLFAAQGFY